MKDSRQEQLVATRREQILDAAARVFAEKGFHKTTIRDIAREASIADGTIYIYFENKAALLLGILDLMQESVKRDEDFSKLAATDLRGFMRAYLRHPLFAPKADNFELFRVVVSEILVNKELRELYYQRILEPTLTAAGMQFEQLAERHAIKSADVDLTMRALSGMVLGLILEHIMGDKTLESRWDELPDFLADLVLDGLRGEVS